MQKLVVTRKITRDLAHILTGKEKKIYLGNLEAKRDWGYAPEYVEAMWLILQQEHPEDFVIGTGEAHSVKDFLKESFSYVNLDWREYIEIDPRYLRPKDINFLLSDASRAREKLGWVPKVTFKELVRMMVDYHLELVGLDLPGEGKKILEEKGISWTKNQLTVK